MRVSKREYLKSESKREYQKAKSKRASRETELCMIKEPN